ncbi:hypothetical protein DOT_5301 [Desulfosporosinus sp. OT]|nr:hypothetical protein DOT_5301 [Desulfosporosinus sp. OT]
MLGGLLGTIVMEFTNTLIYKAKKTEVTYPQITGQFFFSPKRVNRKENFILGQILHFGVGTFFGLPFMVHAFFESNRKGSSSNERAFRGDVYLGNIVRGWSEAKAI